MDEMSTKIIGKYSVMDDRQIQEWRQRGPRQKRIMLLVTLTVFTAGILALILLSTATAYPAQTSQAPEQGGWHRRGMRRGPDQELARLSKKLSLTDGQKAKIKPILEDEHQQLASLRKDSSLSRQDKRSKFMAIRTKTLDQLRPLLTDAQQATLHQMQQKREQRMKSWRERHSGSTSSTPQSQ